MKIKSVDNIVYSIAGIDDLSGLVDRYDGNIKCIKVLNNFKFSKCKNIKSIESVDLSELTNIDYLFSECISLTRINNIIFSKELNSMNYLFSGCGILESLPELDIPNSVEYMIQSFRDCYSLTKLVFKNEFTNIKLCEEIFSGTNIDSNFKSNVELEDSNKPIPLNVQFTSALFRGSV